MKKILLFSLLTLFSFGCSHEENNSKSSSQVLNSISDRGCGAMTTLNQNLKDDPGLAQRMQEIENFTENVLISNRMVNGIIEIPVVVNVLYRTHSENISDAQIDSQIKVLNEDFNAENSDLFSSDYFDDVKANVGIRFVLEKINRKSTSKTSWGTRDDMKKSQKGGINATDPKIKLNIWVCTIGGGILGYAQFPGGNPSTDGIVLDSRYTGTVGTATAPFNLGRTATHEVGHWLNLRHIWGDSKCGNDYVSDTPNHDSYNFGIPTLPHYSLCSGKPIEMTMNYMDYTDDKAMYMFSNGQKSRMLAVFASGGPRSSFAQ